MNNTTPENPKRSTVRTGLVGVAVSTAAILGGLTVLPAIAGAQDTEPQTPDTPDTESEAPEQRRRGHRNRGSQALSEVLDLSREELKEQFSAGNTPADIAAAQGVELDTVIDAITEEAEGRIAAKVEAGRITQEEADEKLAGLEDRIVERLNTVPEPRPRGGLKGEGRAAASEVVQDLLGITEDDIREAFRSGQTMADLAAENGVSTEALVDAIVADVETRIADKLEAGEITQERADSILESLDENVEERVNRERPARGERGPRRGR